MLSKQDIESDFTPRIVRSHDVHLDGEYVDWIAELKHRYRSAQVKASVRVNSEKLHFNWELGRDLVQKKAEERWGAGVVEQVSLDLQREFPNAEGLSAPNLWAMKRWYLFYNQADTKLLQPVIEMSSTQLLQHVAEFPSPLGLIPWGHHIAIISKCKSIEEALFYIGRTIEQGLSRAALVNSIKANLFEHQGKILNNFADHMPELQSKRQRCNGRSAESAHRLVLRHTITSVSRMHYLRRSNSRSAWNCYNVRCVQRSD